MKVSILMLTYNAPVYVWQTIKTLKKTKGVDYELIVVDNNSKKLTKKLVQRLYNKSFIDKLFLNPENSLFAKGNNIASTYASKNSTHYLLLNSDIKINDENWLTKLISIHPTNGGISALGAVKSEPVRADGYCLLIDRDLYDKYKLDENFEWWWSVTKLESQVLQEGKEIIAVDNHEKLIHHYGGKSGKGFKDAKGMNIDIESVKSWFNHKHIKILDHIN